MYKKSKLSLLLVIILFCSLGITTSSAIQDSLGKEFYIVFETNALIPDSLELIIKAEEKDATGVVEVPGLPLSIPFFVTAGTSTTVLLPPDLHDLGNDTVKNDKGVHVWSDEEITVYGLNRQINSSDGFLALPANQLGTEYLVLSSYHGDSLSKSQFAIMASEMTDITITPSIDVAGHLAGISYTIQLDKFETIQLQALGDLSGTEVIATNPIAVFAGNECDQIPSMFWCCSHLVEQLFPVPAWGTSFLTFPLATRTGGDTIRIIAAEEGTTLVYVPMPPVGAPTSLSRGQYSEFIVNSGLSIISDKPIMVVQYSNSEAWDSTHLADPFMMLVRPTEGLSGAYTFVSPASGFDNHYVNIIVPDLALGEVVLDGIPVASGSFSPIVSSGYSGAAIKVTAGDHSVSCTEPIGVQVYGFGSSNSYGYLGGSSIEVAQDNDGDGYTSDVDCDDNNANVNPGAQEIYNLIDDNCNGVVDEGCSPPLGSVTFCSILGDNHNQSPDIDIFKFTADEGELVILSLERDPSGSNDGDLVTLILKDNILRKPPVLIIKNLRKTLPSRIEVKLPESGNYIVQVLEVKKGGGFTGDYCLTLESSFGATQTFTRTNTVEY